MKNATSLKPGILLLLSVICFAQMASAAIDKGKKTAGKTTKPATHHTIVAKAFSDTTLLFEPKGGDSYTMFHVPSMTITSKGTILAFAEGRFGQGKDWDDIDLVYRRSTDNGKTWEPMKILVPHTKGKPTSNLTPIADKNGSVHVLYQVNYANSYYMRSDDEGKTWTKAEDITYVWDKFKTQYNWKVEVPGPDHAIQLTSGRLLVPTWMCIPNPKIPGGDHRPSCIGTIYSDDHGKTWQRGAIIADNGDVTTKGDTIVNPNESILVQLPDGRVMMNIRNENLKNRRLVAYSPDGISNWTKPAFDEDLFDPVCMAAMIKMPDPKTGKTLILFANPDSRDHAIEIKKGRPVWKPRENYTVRLSYDNAKTWPVHRVLEAGPSGYSDLAVDKNGMIYCLLEKQNGPATAWKYRVVMHRFNLDWLTANAK